MTWTAEGSLAGVDGGFVSLSWGKIVNGEDFVQSSWTFVVPGNKASFKVPALPAALAGSAPDGADAAVAFVETDLVATPAQFKALRMPLGGAPDLLTERPFLPANGSLRVTRSARVLIPP